MSVVCILREALQEILAVHPSERDRLATIQQTRPQRSIALTGGIPSGLRRIIIHVKLDGIMMKILKPCSV
jgi:hypothetical protein